MTGEWITFVDSDDFLSTDTFMTCVELIIDKSPDLVEYGYVFADKEGNSVKESYHAVPKGELLDKQYVHEKVIPQLIHTQPANDLSIGAWIWNKLFRAEIVNKYGIRFNETIRLWEDGIFTIEYMQYVTSMVSVGKCFYHYRDTPNSLSTKHDPELFTYLESIYQKYRGIYCKEFDFNSHAAKEYRFNLIHGTIAREIGSDKSLLRTKQVIQKAFMTDIRRSYFTEYHHRNPLFSIIGAAVRLKNLNATATLYWIYFKLFN